MNFQNFLTILLLCVWKVFGDRVPELTSWHESRFISCLYCLDYDRSHIQLLGCRAAKHPYSCVGNACFMRFHKDLASPQIMYTSGCLNLTNSEYSSIARYQQESKGYINGDKDGTLLCESTRKTGTCICSNMHKCNTMDFAHKFTEYNQTEIFKNVTVNEINHIKYFLPQEYHKLQKSHPRRNNVKIQKSNSIFIPISFSISIFIVSSLKIIV
ncbi:unnamed protein product [Caenorhabditis angaria]|uniref:Uncharacterized protein n=1 Tax=Caenorhabditis angaria TaxID=860376 RepID=A0A9P1N8Y6_9PELO|nr:unnamed protein product [Caenorhabditis angaria]